MRTKKIILQTRSSGQQCSFSKATFQNTTTRNWALMCCQSSSHGSPLLWSSGSQCNVKWSRSPPAGRHAGAGGRATGSRCEIWLSSNLIILLIFTCHILKAFDATSWWPWTTKNWEMVLKWVKNTSVILMLNAKHCDKLVTSSLLILPAHIESPPQSLFGAFCGCFRSFCETQKVIFILL